ncbi:MAG: alpha/beta hydrolase, partial [Negativicutes bacterium]|nr:alpha/beta hydrolase [Negativicutes bacterium]
MKFEKLDERLMNKFPLNSLRALLVAGENIKITRLKWIGVATCLFTIIAFTVGQAQEPADSFSSISLSITSGQNGVLVLSGTNISSLRSFSDDQLTTLVNALDATPTIPASALPIWATCWSLQQPDFPPFPGDTIGVNVWPMSDGSFLLDDMAFDYTSPMRVSRMTADGVPLPGGGDDGGTNYYIPNDQSYPPPDYGTNLWICQTSMSSNYLIAIASNTIEDITYTIQSRTNLSQTDWQFEETILGSELTNWTPLSVAQNNRSNLFVRLRAEINSDNSGMPDWWEWEYFGTNSVDPYGDPEGDGYNNIYKYQHGMNPNVFYTPAAPRNLAAQYDPVSGAVTLSWSDSPSPVTGYKVYKIDDILHQEATFTVSTPTLSDNLDADVPNDAWQTPTMNVSYSVQALYAGGNSPQSEPVQVESAAVQISLISDPQGAPVVAISGTPANATTLRLLRVNQMEVFGDNNNTSYNVTQDIPLSGAANGLYPIPSALLTQPFDPNGDTTYYWWAQIVNTNGTMTSSFQNLGQVDFDDPYISLLVPPVMDGRAQLKQNLVFLLRGATATGPVAIHEYSNNVPVDVATNPPNYAYSSFYSFAAPYGLNYSYLDFSRPFFENYLYRNLVFNSSDVDSYGNPITGVNRSRDMPGGPINLDLPGTYYYEFGVSSTSPLLSASSTQWLDFMPLSADGTVGESVGLTTTDNADYTSTYTLNGAHNFFGLPILSVNFWGVDINTGNPLNQVLHPGNAVTAGPYSGGAPVNLYFEAQQPQFQTVGYQFWDNSRDALPGLPLPASAGISFAPTNSSDDTLIVSVGSQIQIAGYAKFAVQNGYSWVYGYLGQYFDKAYTMTNGIATSTNTGVLSPYGTFYATQPGPVALVTMPDIDNGARGTGIVHCVSLQVDKNHDGVMDTDRNGPDATSQLNPMEFWINNGRCTPASAFQSLDKDVPVPPATPNYASPSSRLPYGLINCQRDLENYARLWICGMPALDPSYQVTLRWQNTKLSPAINIYNSVETNGGTGYLTDTNIAAAQCVTYQTSPYTTGPAAGIGTVGPSSPFTFPPNYFANSGNKYLLFEGASEGAGQLVMTITKNGILIAQSSVWIDLHDVLLMYEAVHIANAPDAPPSSTLSDTSYFVSDNTIPENPTDAKQIVVFVHGWRLPFETTESFGQLLFKRLWWQGYQGRFAMIHWPTLSKETDGTAGQFLTFNRDEYIAFKCAQGTANYFTNLQSRFPGYSINVCSHSHGNIIVMEALKRLLASGQKPINNYVMMQAAVAAECFDQNYPSYPPLADGRSSIPDSFYGYAGPIQNAVTGHIANFYNTNDFGV